MVRFSEYFDEWLYGKNGYYTNYKAIGKEGDFFTSVSTTKFFGGAIANKIYELINSKFPQNTTIVEIGAHKGYLLADIIQFLYTFDPKIIQRLKFGILEKFENLRKIQYNYIKQSFGNVINFRHFNSVDEINLDSAIFISNELFDAFSTELVWQRDKFLQMAYVSDEHKIVWRECIDERVLSLAIENKITKGEVPLSYEDFIKKLVLNVNRFYFITFDYGEKYPRNDFSIRIYSEHKTYPLFEPGLNLKNYFKRADITYDVNFALLSNIFKKYGVKEVDYKTQLKAMIEFKITDLLEELKANVDNDTYLREVNKVKMILNPTYMGDRFKMIMFEK